MFNQVILAGIITAINKENKSITIGVEERNQNRTLLEILINEDVFSNLVEYCDVDYVVSVKGKLVNRNGQMFVQAEKVNFLPK